MNDQHVVFSARSIALASATQAIDRSVVGIVLQDETHSPRQWQSEVVPTRLEGCGSCIASSGRQLSEARWGSKHNVDARGSIASLTALAL